MDQAWFEREYFQLHPGKQRYLDHLIAVLRSAGVAPAARVLDIGSGTGLFLSSLDSEGFRATGLELAVEAAGQMMRRNPTLRVVRADADRPLPFHSKRFDCVTALDIIEHLHDPCEMLREARRVLRPGGLAIVITLNARSVARPLLGRRWAFYQDPTHVRLFSASELRASCVAAGLQIRKMVTILNFCSAGESAPALHPLRAIHRVVHVPFGGDSLLALATA